MDAKSPVIIIGMHRSGTSMITRMLEEMGLFWGKKKQEDYEAIFFRKLNDWFFSQSGSAWDNPASIQYLLTNPEVRVLVSDYVRNLLKSPLSTSFMGWSKYVRYGTLEKMDIPWGWKDPRNSYTLPIWRDLFPEAKVIHIYRHGVDVASSLKVRAIKQYDHSNQLFSKFKSLYWLRPKRGGFTDTLRCISLEGGFSLWEEYMNEARKHVNNLQDRAMEIKYEDFLSRPQEVMKSLAYFCDLNPTDIVLNNLANTIDKKRAFAYKSEPELKAFAQKVAGRLQEQGY